MHDEIHSTNEALPLGPASSNGDGDSGQPDLDAAAQAIGLERSLAYLPVKKRSRNAHRVKQCRERAAVRGIAPVTVSLPTAHHQAIKTLAQALKRGVDLPIALKEAMPDYLPCHPNTIRSPKA